MNKRVKKPKKYRRVFTHGIGFLWQADLLDFQNIKLQNDNFAYVCCIVDTFSKMLYTFPLKQKTSLEMVQTLSPLFASKPPKFCQTDPGTEFKNKPMQDMFKKYNVKWYQSYSQKKCVFVERVQRTIRSRLGKVWSMNENKRWIDVLADLTNGYNNSLHSSIKMKPIDVTSEHTRLISQRLFGNRKKHSRSGPKRSIKIGDLVRASALHRTFKKESDNQWTDEIFVVKTVKRTNPPTYILQDFNGEEIMGGFYYEEIQKISHDKLKPSSA